MILDVEPVVCDDKEWNKCYQENFINDQSRRYRVMDSAGVESCVVGDNLCVMSSWMIEEVTDCQPQEWDWCHQNTDDTTMPTRWKAN
jgi:hypothetical protein